MKALFSAIVHYFVLVAALLMPLAASAQTPALPLTYRLKGYTILQECDSKGVAISSKAPVSLPGGASFTITKPVQDKDKNYIIQFWDWSDYPNADKTPDNLRLKNNKLYLFDNTMEFLADNKKLAPADVDAIVNSNYYTFNYNPETGIERYYLISADALALSAVPLVALLSPTGGAVVMPFKFRPSTGDFTKDITFSGMGGISLNIANQQRHTLSLLAGLGITSVTLTPKNSTATENTDRAAISLSLALLYQWERLQMGILSGADYLGEGSASWQYNKKLWLAAGIGFNIFKPEATDAKSTTKQ